MISPRSRAVALAAGLAVAGTVFAGGVAEATQEETQIEATDAALADVSGVGVPEVVMYRVVVSGYAGKKLEAEFNVGHRDGLGAPICSTRVFNAGLAECQNTQASVANVAAILAEGVMATIKETRVVDGVNQSVIVAQRHFMADLVDG